MSQWDKKWVFLFYQYISAVFVNKLLLLIFPWIVPYCRSDTTWSSCTLSETLSPLLDWFSPILVFVVSSYLFLLNVLLVKNYSQSFSLVMGLLAGASTLIIFPSDGQEIFEALLDQTFAYSSDNLFGIVMDLVTYPLFFGIVFLLGVGIYKLGTFTIPRNKH